jgi:succinate dehydrogenase assembly factor 2
VKTILEKDKKLRDQYLVFEANMTETERDLNRRKRMIYRSKQRGWLEADLLMGSWAAQYVPTLTNEELDEYEILLQEETIDIYNYISKKDPLPPHLQILSVMKKLQDYALTKNMASPDGYKEVKERTNLI